MNSIELLVTFIDYVTSLTEEELKRERYPIKVCLS
jgi:hypothetical protein